MKIHRVLPWLTFMAVTAAGAAAPWAHIRERDPTWIAPDRAASKVNPLAGRPETAAGGRKVFEQRCTTCHGPAAGGTTRAPDLLARDAQAQSDGALFWKIGSGSSRAGMPSFSFLPEAQRWQLVLHLRSLARAGGLRDDAE